MAIDKPLRYSGPDTLEQLITVPPTKLGFPRAQKLVKEVFDVSGDDATALPPPEHLGDFSLTCPRKL